jgi:SlyX protein
MSNDPKHNLNERLETLESRFAFQEELISQLDEVVLSQANEIDSLKREMLKIRTEMTHDPETEATMEEQVPPHY